MTVIELPETPFHIYLLDANSEISPKQIFIVTRKRFNVGIGGVEVFISDLEHYVPFNPECMKVVSIFSVN